MLFQPHQFSPTTYSQIKSYQILIIHIHELKSSQFQYHLDNILKFRHATQIMQFKTITHNSTDNTHHTTHSIREITKQSYN